MDLVDSEVSSDDSDFCPEKHKDSNSEISEPEEDDHVESDEDNDKKKSKKSKKVSKRRKPKTATKKIEEEKCEEKMVSDPEEEKRKADAIWAEFLGETETHTNPKKSEASSRATSTSSMSSSSRTSSRPETKQDIPAKAPAVTELFEFAGETVKIPSKIEEANDPPTTTAKPGTPGVKRAGGLSSVLNQLTKKNKLSVLEKTKLDWDGFKSEEGINEELQTHNRGREGFLERKDFLQRTDLRQFEIEKNMRLSRRK